MDNNKLRSQVRDAAEEAEELRQAHEQISLLLDAAPIACTLWDKDFKVIGCNEEAVRLFGLKGKQDVREKFNELSPEYQPDGRRSIELAAQYIQKAYDEGKCVFEWLHQTVDGTLFPAEVTLIGMDIKVARYMVTAYIRDLREQKRMMAEIERRDSLLDVVNQAADILLRSESDGFDANILHCIGMIGTAVGADRVSTWKNYHKDGRLHCSQIHEWVRGESDKCILVDTAYDALPGWEKTLSGGECISSLISDMSPEEQEQLGPDGVLSLFVVPVFAQTDKFWGFVCFDNCREERIYTETEKTILRSGSLLIAHAFMRHEMTQHIRETAAWLQTVIAHYPGIIWRVNMDGMISLFDGMLVKKLGIPPGLVDGKTLDEAPPNIVTPEIAENVRKTFTHGAQEWISETGMGIFFIHTSPVYGDDGEMTGVVGDADDIAEMVHLQDKLKDALSKANQANIQKNLAVKSLERIMNSIDALIYITVPETGEFLFVNNYMKKKFNKNGNELIGDYCYKIFYGNDRMCSFCPCFRLREKSDAKIVWDEYLHVLERHVRHSDCLIDWPNGKKVHLQHTVDITELVEAREAAEQSNQAKGVFLAQMSHEIRTPINAILGISEIQLRDERLSADVEEGFRQIYDSGNLLLNIINDILDFSKIDAGKLEIIPVKYDIPSLINDTAQLCALRYESKPIEFIVQVDENVPRKLIGDELRIKQILNNLLSNSFKYTDAGHVTLSAAAEPGYNDETVTLVFKVSDTGQGMSQMQVGRIFIEYERFNMQENRGITGTGLGMPITNRLVTMMGGEIFVESELNKGTLVTVRLPQKKCGPAVCGAEIVKKLRNFVFDDALISKKTSIIYEYMPYGRVLIVDDVASNLYVVRGLLAPYGLQIETATSGIEAIEKIKAGNIYDIIFMDHMMPKMDGIRATEILRDTGYTHPVVALTANAMSGQAEMFLSLGFDKFISKPIDSRELDLVLTELIRDKKPRVMIEAARREKEKTAFTPEKDLTELVKYFILDAENIIKVLENTCAKTDGPDDAGMEAYTTAVHGIKSALANIGEAKLSEFAFKLEKAGEAGNFGVVAGETPAFINKLKALVAKLKPREISGGAPVSSDDMLLLREKLPEFKTACEELNLRAAKAILNDLRQKTWPREVDDAINEISVSLLRGEYKKVVSIAEKLAR